MTIEGAQGERADRLDRFIVASVLLHAGLFSLILLSPRLFPDLGPNWGAQTGTPDAGIQAKIVGSLSGIALPAPPVVNEKAPANESPGLYKSPEAAPRVPDKAAEPIPEKTAPVKPPPPKPNAAPPTPKSAPTAEPPANAVPYGQGGRPALSYGQFSTGAGDAGIGFGDAAFGDRYASYVSAITRAISNNWLRSMVDARIQRAPRVYLTFKIAKNGKISDLEVQQSSGIPTLDRSAQRAVLASDPLPALPADYRGSDVSVNFYFEYSR
jgi:periplasmic protein TonB